MAPHVKPMMVKIKNSLKRGRANEQEIIEERERLMKKLKSCEKEFKRINVQFEKLIKYIEKDIDETIEEILQEVVIHEQ